MKDRVEHPHFAYSHWFLWHDRESGKLYIDNTDTNTSKCVGTIRGDDERRLLFRFLNEFGDYCSELGADSP